MHKATGRVEALVRQSDLLIEVRDARVPFSSVNPALEALKTRKLVVYNKVDLSDKDASKRLARDCRQRGEMAVFMSATSDVSSVIKWLIHESPRQFKSAGSLAMVVGMPNVGKSTLINAVAHRLKSRRRGRRSKTESSMPLPASLPPRARSKSVKQVARVGAEPGVTRQSSSILVCESPVVRLIDTPGIMTPKIPNAEVGLRLALTGAIKDSIVGEDVLVEYLFHLLEEHGLLDKLNSLVAEGVVDVAAHHETRLRDIDDLVDFVERASGSTGKHPEERTRRACAYVLARWRAGDLGRYTIDHVP